MSNRTFRLGAFTADGGQFIGLVFSDDMIVDLPSAASRVGLRQLASAVRIEELLADWDRKFDALCELAGHVDRQGVESFAPLSVADLRPLPPIVRPGRLLYAAANYRDHVAGMRKTFSSTLPPVNAKPEAELKPYLFAKACATSGAFDDIVLPRGLQRIDWEAELAVVIGRRGKNVPPEKVSEHIAGYMTTNDVSCRDLTWREDRPALRSDWLSGKSFDSFAPMGPYLTPKAFVPDHANVGIKLWVNGILKQDGNSRDMVFSIEDQIAYAARMVTLEPGDTFATGTPAGTGQERLEFLAAGDLVETEVEHCGRQRNQVTAGNSEYRR